VSFEHLQLFRDIAAHKSLSRGAEMNGVSPSAASQHLHELERSLGTVLLDRSTRPLCLTTAGRLYHDMCRDILRRRDEFDAALGELKINVEGIVRIASIYSVGLSEMSQLESEFHRRHPHVKMQVDYLRPEKVYEAVASDRADLGLVSYPEARRDIAVIAWRQEEMVVAAAPSHPLARRSAVEPRDMAGLDFIGFDEDLPIRRDVDRYLRSQDVEVNVVMHFDNLQTIKEAIALGSGVSIVPARILRAEIEQGRLAAIPIAAPGLFRPLGIVHRKKKRFHRAAQSFLELLQETPAAPEPATLLGYSI
jgi:DNA-binding transcriptional LysR family regulator